MQNVFGGGEMEDKRFWPGKSGSAHEIRVPGLAYRDDTIGDSRVYAHALILHEPMDVGPWCRRQKAMTDSKCTMS